jgi:hypothetical protein
MGMPEANSRQQNQEGGHALPNPGIKQGKENSETEQEKQGQHTRTPEEEVDEFVRSFKRDLKRKIKSAGLGETVGTGANLLLVIVGIIAASIYGCQLDVMSGQLQQMQATSVLASKQLELLDRPWIFVAFTVESPITFNSEQMRLNLRVHFKNVGHAVATNIVITQNAFLTANPFRTVLSRQKALCDKTATDTTGMNEGRLEMTLFPGNEDSSLGVGTGISMPDIMANLLDTHLTPSFHDKVFGPVFLVGCVDYQYAASSIHHQTRFAYEVGRALPHFPPDAVAAIKVGEDVPIEAVRMTRWIFGGDQAY